jgi:caa(3)-type oxidase subunit IV
MSSSQGPDESTVSYATHASAHDAAHGPSTGIYYTIFGCLAFMTFITVFVSRVNLPAVPAVIIAFLIAISKATLVIAFFMHLKYDPKVMRMMCVVPVVLTMIAMMALMPDIALHGPQAAGPPEVAAHILNEYAVESGVPGAHAEPAEGEAAAGEAGGAPAENAEGQAAASEPAADQQAPASDAKDASSK